MMAPMPGFMPSLDFRLSMASTSGTTANAVPNPARKLLSGYFSGPEQPVVVANQVLAICQRDQAYDNSDQHDQVALAPPTQLLQDGPPCSVQVCLMKDEQNPAEVLFRLAARFATEEWRVLAGVTALLWPSLFQLP